jgi:homoserine kinase
MLTEGKRLIALVATQMIVAALAAANKWLGLDLDADTLVKIAVAMEGALIVYIGGQTLTDSKEAKNAKPE